MRENKDLEIFFNSHRYTTSLEYASIKNIIHNIEILSKKKISNIKLMGNLRFNFFSKKVFKDELKLKNINLDIGFVKNVSKFNSIEFYDFLRKFNSLTF